MSGTVVVVGSLNADLQIEVATLPAPGETVLATGADTRPGGKGANQAAAVALAGGTCWMVGAVGDDDEGRLLTAALDEVGVRTDTVDVLRGTSSGRAVVMVEPSGENAIVVVPGANGEVTPRQVRELTGRVGAVDTVLTQGELSPSCIVAASEAAVAVGARLVVNLAPYTSLPADVLARCDPLVVNELEAAALGQELTGRTLAGEELLRALVPHTRSVIITLGGAGALHGSAAGQGEVPAPQVEVVDTSGAGDAFVGAATVEMTRTGDLAAACRAGVAAGSAAVQHRGARMAPMDDAAAGPV
ncbi:ribokinase [Auraticoccus monumenti]|uniref:Ribokinase n=1 Tax=Auraticoccus monumenti TaxID=675864 RepID=A0A1G6T7G6_9ACTN|nr:ribokinase [Auraticoccus monumenti]SDD24335.1 ribokinase [Auraticoccus monumenti]